MAKLRSRLGRISDIGVGNGQLHELKPGDDESAQAFINFWATRRDDILGPVHRKAYKQLAWVLGHQNQDFDVTRNTLNDPADFGEWPWWRVRAIENRLLGVVEGRLSKRNARQPIWKHRPRSGSDEDVSASRVGTAVLQQTWRRVRMAERLYQAEWWGEVTGTGYLFATWDPFAGPQQDFSVDQLSRRFGEANPDDEQFFRQLFGDENDVSLNLGDIAVGVHTVFDCFVDPHAKAPEEVQWAILERFRSLDYLQDRYGNKVINAGLNTGTMTDGSNRGGIGGDEIPYYYQVMELTAGANARQLHDEQDHFLVRELWVKPSKKRPKGMHAISVAGRIIQNQPNPYEHRQIPIMFTWGVPVEGSMLGTSKVEQLMETQRRLNEIRSNKTEYMRLHIYPKWLLPEQAEVAEDAITTEFGEGIEYSGPIEPKVINPPAMPNYMESLEHDAIEAFRDLADLHEVSQAQTPGGVRSGTAITALMSQDDARFVNIIKMRNLQLARFGELILHMSHQFITEERTVELIGQDEMFDVMTFTGADLVGGDFGTVTPDYFNVEVEIDSELPLSVDGQRQLIEGLVQNGVLNPEADRDLILRMVGLGSADPIIKRQNQHRSLARRENRMLRDGQWVAAERHQDHQAHLDVLERFMNSDQYFQVETNVKNLFERHRAMHYQLQAIEMLRGQLVTQMALPIAEQVFQNEMKDIQQSFGMEPVGIPQAPGGALAPPTLPQLPDGEAV